MSTHKQHARQIQKERGWNTKPSRAKCPKCPRLKTRFAIPTTILKPGHECMDFRNDYCIQCHSKMKLG